MSCEAQRRQAGHEDRAGIQVLHPGFSQSSLRAGIGVLISGQDDGQTAQGRISARGTQLWAVMSVCMALTLKIMAKTTPGNQKRPWRCLHDLEAPGRGIAAAHAIGQAMLPRP